MMKKGNRKWRPWHNSSWLQVSSCSSSAHSHRFLHPYKTLMSVYLLLIKAFKASLALFKLTSIIAF